MYKVLFSCTSALVDLVPDHEKISSEEDPCEHDLDVDAKDYADLEQ